MCIFHGMRVVGSEILFLIRMRAIRRGLMIDFNSSKNLVMMCRGFLGWWSVRRDFNVTIFLLG